MRKFALLALSACLSTVYAFAQAPNTISGLSLWLDAADPNGNGSTPGNGSAITTWVDKSGNGRNALAVSAGGYVNPTFSASAINGKGTISFTKSAASVSGYTVPGMDIRASVNPDVTIFTVYRQGTPAVAGDQALWGNDNGGWDRFFFSKLAGTNGAVSQGPVSPFMVTVANAGVPGSVRLLTAVYDGNVGGGVNNGAANASAVYFNGQVVTEFADRTDPVAAQTALRIGYDGDDNWYGGEIAEMIVYNRVLSLCEIQSINAYLSTKYAQTYNKPSISASTSFLCGATTSATLTAGSMGSGYTYQWLKNNVAIGGATGLTYNATTAGSYRIIANSLCGPGDTSAAITVTASGSAASVTQPLDVTECAGVNTTLSAFSGTAGSYTWTNNNTATGIAASGTGNIPAFTATNATTAPITSTITVTPVGSGVSGFAYIPNVTAGNTTVLNLATNTVATTLNTGATSFAVTVLPDNSKAFVSSVGTNSVSVISTATNTIVGSSPYNQPHGLVPAPDGSRVYVNGYGGGGALSWIDPVTYGSTFMGAVPNPEGMTVTPDGSKVFVASSTAPGKIYVFNTAAPYASSQITVGDYPQGVAVAPDGRYVYVAVTNAGVVSVIDVTSNTVVANIPVGTAPLGVAVTPDGTRVYVTNAASDNVSVISTASNTVTATIAAGDYPYGISITPDGSKVYVANRLGNNLTVIATATNTASTVAVPGLDGPIAIGNMLAASYQCDGPAKTFTVTVNPKPSWSNAGFTTSICNDQGIGLSISNGGNTPGATYSWTNDNPAIGTPATGSGNGLSFTGTNTGTTSIAGNFVVTPSYTNNGVTCVGTPGNFTITVRPTANVDNVSNQAVCAGGNTAAVNFTGNIAGTTYSWTNSNPAIGLAGSGTGDIASFTAVNATSSPVTATITVTPQPASAAANTAYVSGYNTNKVYLVDLATGTVLNTISVVNTPTDMALSSDKSKLFVAQINGNVSVINTATNTVTGTITTSGSRGVKVSADGSKVYVTTFGGELRVYNAATLALMTTVSITGLADNISLSPDGTKLLVSNNSNTLRIVNTATDAVSNTLTVGANSTGAIYSLDGTKIYSANYGAGTVTVYDATTFALLNTITVGGSPFRFTMSADGSRLYVSNYNSNAINVINTATNAVVSTITGITGAVETTLSSDGTKLYANGNTGSGVYIISTATNLLTGSIATGSTTFRTVLVAGAGACAGASKMFTITVNPQPAATISYTGSPFCATGTATPTLTGTTGGTYSSTAGLSINGTTGVIDLAASTPGTYTITYNIPAGSGCAAVNATASVTISGTGTVTQPGDQTVCAGNATAAVNFTGTASLYTWTNNTTSIGLAASGTGSIGSFTAVNATAAPVTATITVTPKNLSTGYAYIPGEGNATVTVVNPATGAVVTTIPVGAGPVSTIPSPDGSRMYVSNYGAGSVSVINTATNTVTATITTGANAYGMAINSDGSRLYVSNKGNNTVSVINTATNAVITNYTVAQSSAVALSPDGTVLYASDATNGRVVRMDAATGTVTGTVNTGTGAWNLILSPDGARLYVSNAASNTVSAIDVASFTVLSNITVGGFPVGLAITPDGGRVYVSSINGNPVAVINTTTLTVVDNVVMGGSTYGISINYAGTEVYAMLNGLNQVKVISTATNTVTNTIAMPGNPSGMGNIFVPLPGCSGAPKTFTITVNPVPNATFSYTGSPYCSGPGTATPTMGGTVGTTGGTFSSTTGLSIDANTGNINIATSTPGTYTVTYTLPASGGCAQYTTTASVTISAPATTTITPSGPTTICNGGSVTLSVPAGATSYLWSNGATTNSITVSTAGSYSVTVTSGACVATGGPVTVSVNPVPTVNAVTSQTVCDGINTTAVSFSGATPGTVFNWSNNNTSIGLGATGSGDIAAFAGTNSGTAPASATVTVTPSYTNGGTTCTGTAGTFTITVNPRPTATISASQTVCAGANTSQVTLGASSVYTGGTLSYSWTANNTATGLSALSGSGNIAPFVAANATNAPISSTITGTATFTPTAGGAALACASTNAPQHIITVNPKPVVNAVTSQSLCNGANTAAITFSGNVPSAVYSWTNNTPSIGLAGSGSGNVASFPAVNNGTAPVTATITVTPSFTSGITCTGTPVTFGITVNPTPTVNNIANQSVCNGALTTAVAFGGTVANTAYNWTNNTPSIGLAASGTGNIAAFNAINNGTTPVTATITVTPQATLTGRAYVPNNGSGTVSVIDITDGSVVGTIPVGANPFGVAVTPDRSTVFVTNTGGNSVSVISTASNTVTATSPFNQPHGIVASPDGTRVYVNGWGGNAVSYIPVATPATSTFMVNVNNPEGMAVSADGSRLYVASSTNSGNLVVINTTNSTIVSTIPVGSFPQGVAISNDGSKVYVVNNGSNSVSVISTASNTVTGTITVGTAPLGVAVHPDGSKLYVTNSGSNNVSVINTATNAVSATVPVGNFPYGIAVAPDGSNFYVANKNSNNVMAVSAATNTIVGTVPVGNSPIALGANTTASLQCAGTPKTFTITVNPTPTVNAVANQTLCNGSATTAVNFGGAVSGTTYSWVNNTPSIGLAANGTGNIASFTATNTTNAPVTATVTVTPSANGCSGTPVTFTITVNPTPSANAVTSQVVCNGGTTAAINFAGPVAGTTYSWSNSNATIGLAASGTGNIAAFTATNAGATVQTATITVTPSANGCPGTPITFTITVNPTPTVNSVTSQTLCNGAPTTAVSFAGAVTGTVYNWANNTTSIGLAATGTGNIASFNAVNAGTSPVTATITVTPSFTNGGQTCTGTAGAFTITVNPTPSVNAVSNQTLCNGAATTAVNFAGPVAGTTYNWVNNTPSIGLAATGTGDIAAFNAVNNGSSPVTATVTVTPSANGCAGTPVTFTITVNPTPTVNAVTPITVCAGQNITVQNFGGAVAGTLFSWSNDNTAIGLGANGTGNIAPFTATNTTAAPITANITVTPTANSCAGTPVTFTITVNPLPTGTITAPNGTLICQGSSVPLQVSGGTSYQWFIGGNPIAGATGATYNATQAGTYSVNITNSFGCTQAASNTVTTTFVAKPVAGFSWNSYCQNLPVQFTNSTSTTGSGTVTYQWTFGNGQTSTLQTPAPVTYTTPGAYMVQLVASPNGCVQLNDTLRKTIIIEAPIAGMRLPLVNVVSGVATQIQGRNFPNGQYSWTPTTGLSNPLIFYPMATLTQETEYRITASFASGCQTVDTLLVRVMPGTTLIVPTAFSPNGDGQNDVLRPITAGISSLRSFRVLDRMGRVLFQTGSMTQGWDGTYMGKALPSDTYTWVVEGWDTAGKPIQKAGQVLLVR